MTEKIFEEELYRLKTINSVASEVGRSLDLNSVLDAALSAAMRVFNVDSGGIYLFNPDSGKLELTIFTNLSKPYLDEKSIVGVADGCTGVAARSQEIFAAFDHPESSFICEDSRRLLGVDCMVAAPLVSSGQVVGVLELFAPTSRRLTRKEAHLIAILGAQMAVAIENAQLYSDSQSTVEQLEKTRADLVKANSQLQAHLEEEAFIARTLQQALLPPPPKPIQGLDIGTFYTSATKHALIGGDFYDIVSLPKGRQAFVIGDASGHGVIVSPRSAQAKFSINAYLSVGRSPARALELANQASIYHSPEKFVTAFVAVLDTDNGALSYSIAGHPPPLVHRGSRGGAQILESGTPALGILDHTRYHLLKSELAKGDVLLMYTDGLTEARNADHEFFGVARVFRALEESSDMPATDIVTNIAKSAYKFAEGDLSDDMAIVAVRYTG